MNGAGNDFVFDRQSPAEDSDCSPRKSRGCATAISGVGADGVILLTPCLSGHADWAWDFYNSDGSSAEMCGNGARCFARYVRRLTGGNGPLIFETRAGVITARFNGQTVTVTLTPPRDLRLRQRIALSAGPAEIHSLDTGVPHAVLFVPDADQAMVQPLGAEIRFHSHFAPRGTNVNFVQALGPGKIRVRTYERGVEGETLACGTGVTASALIAAELRGFPRPSRCKSRAGIPWKSVLSGPAGNSSMSVWPARRSLSLTEGSRCNGARPQVRTRSCGTGISCFI